MDTQKKLRLIWRAHVALRADHPRDYPSRPNVLDTTHLLKDGRRIPRVDCSMGIRASVFDAPTTFRDLHLGLVLSTANSYRFVDDPRVCWTSNVAGLWSSESAKSFEGKPTAYVCVTGQLGSEGAIEAASLKPRQFPGSAQPQLRSRADCNREVAKQRRGQWGRRHPEVSV